MWLTVRATTGGKNTHETWNTFSLVILTLCQIIAHDTYICGDVPFICVPIVCVFLNISVLSSFGHCIKYHQKLFSIRHLCWSSKPWAYLRVFQNVVLCSVEDWEHFVGAASVSGGSTLDSALFSSRPQENAQFISPLSLLYLRAAVSHKNTLRIEVSGQCC